MRVRAVQLLGLAREHRTMLGERLMQAGVTFVVATDDDALTRGDAIDGKATSLVAAALPSLGGIGVLPSVDLTLTEPFNVAREAATIDILTEGRAGLALLPPVEGLDAATYGVPYLDLAEPTTLLRESIEVLRLLWDSWEPGAVARDWTTNRFVDADRVRTIDFNGDVLHVAGPAATPRSPQGVLPIAVDLTDDPDPAVALAGWASSADLAFVSAETAARTPPGAAGRPDALRQFAVTRMDDSKGDLVRDVREAEAAGHAIAGAVVDVTALDAAAVLSRVARAGEAWIAAVGSSSTHAPPATLWQRLGVCA